MLLWLNCSVPCYYDCLVHRLMFAVWSMWMQSREPLLNLSCICWPLREQAAQQSVYDNIYTVDAYMRLWHDHDIQPHDDLSPRLYQLENWKGKWSLIKRNFNNFFWTKTKKSLEEFQFQFACPFSNWNWILINTNNFNLRDSFNLHDNFNLKKRSFDPKMCSKGRFDQKFNQKLM